jgi:hypothetical protein
MRKSPRPKNDDEIKFSLRIPKDDYEAIREVAEGERRSINSQVVLIIKQWIRDHTIPVT